MGSQGLRKQVQSLLDRAGVELDGTRPWDPAIHDQRFFARVLSQGSLGFGESYMDGWWDCERLDQFVERLKRARLDRAVRARPPLWNLLKAKVLNLQSRARAFEIGERHYDLGNDLYEAMLDRRMIYTGGLWDGATDLDTAQERKLERVARKLKLRPGQRVLDIGCGWGGTAKYLAENHGVHVVGVTVSGEQQRHAQELCRDLPVEIRLCDYRDVHDTFDRVVSLGMIEHVGQRNYRTYFDVVQRCLRDEGLFVLQTIGASEAEPEPDPWIERYIFPNSILPSAKRVGDAFGDRMVLEHWENFGPHYDRTLMAWHENFERAWPALRDRYDERFHRMWRFYLLSCAGAFRSRAIQLWQMVLSPEGVVGGYRFDPPRSERLEEGQVESGASLVREAQVGADV